MQNINGPGKCLVCHGGYTFRVVVGQIDGLSGAKRPCIVSPIAVRNFRMWIPERGRRASPAGL